MRGDPGESRWQSLAAFVVGDFHLSRNEPRRHGPRASRQARRAGFLPVRRAFFLRPGPAPALIRSQLEKIATQQLGRKVSVGAVVAISVAQDIPVAEMQALLPANIPVTEDGMRELAVQRGVAVKDDLGAQKLPVERLFLGAVKPAQSDPKWSPRAELEPGRLTLRRPAPAQIVVRRAAVL